MIHDLFRFLQLKFRLIIWQVSFFIFNEYKNVILRFFCQLLNAVICMLFNTDL